MSYSRRFALFAAAFICSVPCFAQEITVTPAKSGGIYAVGEKIVWRIGVTGDGASGIDKVRYVLKKGGLTEIKSGELTLKDNAAELETSLDAPGTVLAELQAGPVGKGAIKNLAGAVVAPDKIEPSAPCRF
jgi:hypothetical protein